MDKNDVLPKDPMMYATDLLKELKAESQPRLSPFAFFSLIWTAFVLVGLVLAGVAVGAWFVNDNLGTIFTVVFSIILALAFIFVLLTILEDDLYGAYKECKDKENATKNITVDLNRLGKIYYTESVVENETDSIKVYIKTKDVVVKTASFAVEVEDKAHELIAEWNEVAREATLHIEELFPEALFRNNMRSKQKVENDLYVERDELSSRLASSTAS